jgi:hypothetical protein
MQISLAIDLAKPPHHLAALFARGLCHGAGLSFSSLSLFFSSKKPVPAS